MIGKQINYEQFWLLREVGTGIIALLLAIITYALGTFIHRHRVSLTVEDREAKDAAIGLVVIFAALMVRAFDLWVFVVAERNNWTELAAFAGASWVYFATLVTVLIGVVLTVKAFHPWPMWAIFVGAAVGIPIGVSFIGV